MDLAGKPNTNANAGQVCIGEAFSKLAKYEQDSGK